MNRRSLRQSQMPDNGASKKGEGAAKTQSSSASAGEDMLKDENDTGIKEASDCITWIPDRPDVFLHGTYDVEMAGPGIHERQSCNDGDYYRCF